MDDSFDDFVLVPPKAKVRKPFQDISNGNSRQENSNSAVSKVKFSVSLESDKQVQCSVSMKEKSTQCGFEDSVSYCKKLEAKDGEAKHVTYRTLIMEVIPNKEATLDFCFKMKLIPSSRECPTCGKSMRLIADSRVSDNHRWYCRERKGRNKHEHRLSIRTGTFFEKSNLTLEEILQFIYLWVHGSPQDLIQHEVGTSNKTDVDWANFCREVCDQAVMGASEKIGGPDIVVEIDESKFAKRKYNVGHRVVGGWVFGGREKDNKRKVFMVPVENRTAETLLGIIQTWIAPGSIIWSDCWKSYGGIPDLPQGYKHGTVNHSKNFVDPATGVCTNRIESDWRHAKAAFPRYGTRPEHYTGYLALFMWKRRHSGEDLFMEFIRDVAATYPGPESTTVAE